jgi:hypothetical protein
VDVAVAAAAARTYLLLLLLLLLLLVLLVLLLLLVVEVIHPPASSDATHPGRRRTHTTLPCRTTRTNTASAPLFCVFSLSLSASPIPRRGARVSKTFIVAWASACVLATPCLPPHLTKSSP